jgi:glycosyltransferase involved in cell wall biosynthesis
MNDNNYRADLSVLHISAGRYNPEDNTHSTFTIWRELSKGFRRYTVVGRSERSSFSRIEEQNLTIYLLPSYFKSEAEFLFTQAKAVKIGENIKCDVVVAQCPVKGGLAGLELSRRRGAKLLTELHGFEYFANVGPVTAKAAIQVMSGYPLRHSHRIRVLSEGMREKIIKKYGSSIASKIVCLPPRVDLTRFKNIKTDWSISDKPKILMVGTINENKGQRRLISTLLKSKLDLEIWIVGTGPDLKSVRELTISLDGEQRVKFFGQKSHDQLAYLLPKADVFVMYSYSEGMPRAMIEAMAVGLPIITTNAGFCSDVIENELQGIILGDNPDVEIIKQLNLLINNDELRARLGRAARIRAETDFDAVKLYDRYRTLIKETADL